MMDKGAHFHKCDFQVHSPRDHHWTGQVPITDDERHAYAGTFVQACREKGIGAVAITDHHDLAFVKYFKQAASNERDENGAALAEHERLIVFPGIELTLSVPCQALLIFDADFPEEWYELVLTSLAIGIQPASEGKGPGPNQERLEYDSLADVCSALDRQTVIKGRYVLWPNVSDGGGSTILRSGMAPKYIAMPCLGGYVDGNANSLGEGAKRILKGADSGWGNKSLAVFQTSDSRRFDHVNLGVPSTWVKWASPTAEALRQACLASESRVSLQEPQLPSTYIQSISVSNSKFLGPVTLQINPQYNALIGGRGTGKSTVLEYLRWALCDQPLGVDDSGEVPDYLKRRESLVANTLVPLNSSVEIHFVANGVDHVVRRNSTDSKVILKIGDGEYQASSEAEIRRLIAIQAYSQKQLSSVGVRVEELSRFLEAPGLARLQEIDESIHQVSSRIREAHANRLEYRMVATVLREKNTQLDSVKKQAESIRSTLQGLTEDQKAVISDHAGYQDAQQFVSGVINDVRNASIALADALSSLEKLPRHFENEKEWTEKERLNRIHETARLVIRASQESISAQIELLNSSLSEGGELSIQLDEWKAIFSKHSSEYKDATEATQSQQSKLVELTGIEGRISVLAKSVDESTAQLRAHDDPEQRYQELWTEWKELHKKRVSTLQELGDELKALSDQMIRATMNAAGSRPELEGRLKELFRGSGIHAARIEEIVTTVQEAEKPIDKWIDLVFELQDLASWNSESGGALPDLTVLSTIGDSQLQKLADSLSPDRWLDFALMPLRPMPSFEFRARENDYISFVDASAGQQATALLTSLLNQNGPPLIIDQPEDDLDNQVILEVVRKLWSAKAHRQLIFASHNANLVVNGDADYVASFDYRTAGDASGGKVSSEGAIDVPETNTMIKKVMEGGERAFILRKDKYGF